MQHFPGSWVFRETNLAIGIACAGLIFLWVEDEYAFDGGNVKKDWLYAVLVTTAFQQLYSVVLTEGLHLLTGKDFSSPADSSDMLINASMARLIVQQCAITNFAALLGKIIRVPSHADNLKFIYYAVAGIVNDYIYDGNFYGDPGPLILACQSKRGESILYARTMAGADPARSLAKIEAVVQGHNPGYPFQYNYVEDPFNDRFKSEELMGETAWVFIALIGWIFAAAGVLALGIGWLTIGVLAIRAAPANPVTAIRDE